MQTVKHKKAGAFVFVSDKIDFKERNVTRDKKGILHNDQGSIY